MVAIPSVLPVTTPVTALIAASDVLLLLHMPPAVTSEHADGIPRQRFEFPVMAAGSGLTVSIVVAEQPRGSA